VNRIIWAINKHWC